MNKRIVGVFTAEHEASRAIEDLKRHGFRTEDISIITRNKDDANTITEETGTKVPEGMASGAATGGLLGGVTGLLLGIGALAIPGIGPILAAGPIAATLAGAAVGAGTGGLVGGMIGLGFPEDEAESYDRYVGEGRILVMVDAQGDQESEVDRIFKEHNSLNRDRVENITDDTLAMERGRDNHVGGDSRAMERDYTERSAAADTDDSVRDTIDAAFNGSGLEGKADTGLDTMNAGAGTRLPGDRAGQDIHRPGMTGAVDESDELRASDQKDARDLAHASGTMDSMDILANERVRNAAGEHLTVEERKQREWEMDLDRSNGK